MSQAALFDARWKKVKFIPSDMNPIYVSAQVKNNH
jgi:hypothetical protein